jgi:hypothetical protein
MRAGSAAELACPNGSEVQKTAIASAYDRLVKQAEDGRERDRDQTTLTGLRVMDGRPPGGQQGSGRELRALLGQKGVHSRAVGGAGQDLCVIRSLGLVR